MPAHNASNHCIKLFIRNLSQALIPLVLDSHAKNDDKNTYTGLLICLHERLILFNTTYLFAKPPFNLLVIKIPPFFLACQKNKHLSLYCCY